MYIFVYFASNLFNDGALYYTVGSVLPQHSALNDVIIVESSPTICFSRLEVIPGPTHSEPRFTSPRRPSSLVELLIACPGLAFLLTGVVIEKRLSLCEGHLPLVTLLQRLCEHGEELGIRQQRHTKVHGGAAGKVVLPVASCARLISEIDHKVHLSVRNDRAHVRTLVSLVGVVEQGGRDVLLNEEGVGLLRGVQLVAKVVEQPDVVHHLQRQAGP